MWAHCGRARLRRDAAGRERRSDWSARAGNLRGQTVFMLTVSSTVNCPVTVMLGRFQALSPLTASSGLSENAPMRGLTARETQVLTFLSAGRTYREIADALCIRPETVHSHCKHIYRKLGVTGRHRLKGIKTPLLPLSSPSTPG